MMNLNFLAKTLDVTGKLMVAYTAIAVHHRVWKDHKIDRRVISMMRLEQFFGVLGILFIIAAYLIEVLFLFQTA